MQERAERFPARGDGSKNEKRDRERGQPDQGGYSPPCGQQVIDGGQRARNPGGVRQRVDALLCDAAEQARFVRGEATQFVPRMHARSFSSSSKVASNGRGWRAMKRRNVRMIASSEPVKKTARPPSAVRRVLSQQK